MLRIDPPDCGCLFVVSGPSGVGKSTLIQAAMRTVPRLGFSISATTRAPRGVEQHGREYYFLSPEEFETRVQEGEFLEHASVYDRRYGTLRAPVLDAIESGSSILLDIDVQGARQVKVHYPDCVRIYVLPPRLGVLEERLRARGTDTEEVLRRRMGQVDQQLLIAPEFDYIVVNDDREAAEQQFAGIFLAELARRERKRSAIRRVLDEIRTG